MESTLTFTIDQINILIHLIDQNISYLTFESRDDLDNFIEMNIHFVYNNYEGNESRNKRGIEVISGVKHDQVLIEDQLMVVYSLPDHIVYHKNKYHVLRRVTLKSQEGIRHYHVSQYGLIHGNYYIYDNDDNITIKKIRYEFGEPVELYQRGLTMKLTNGKLESVEGVPVTNNKFKYGKKRYEFLPDQLEIRRDLEFPKKVVELYPNGKIKKRYSLDYDDQYHGSYQKFNERGRRIRWINYHHGKISKGKRYVSYSYQEKTSKGWLFLNIEDDKILPFDQVPGCGQVQVKGDHVFYQESHLIAKFDFQKKKIMIPDQKIKVKTDEVSFIV